MNFQKINMNWTGWRVIKVLRSREISCRPHRYAEGDQACHDRLGGLTQSCRTDVIVILF